MEISKLLGQFPDMDQMLTGLTYIPKSATANTVKSSIDTLIFIKHSIRCAVQLSHSFQSFFEQESSQEILNSFSVAGNTQSYIQTFVDNLCNDNLQLIENEISQIISESTVYTKSAQEMRFQECFAIKSGTNGLLDVARKTVLLAVEEIHEVSLILHEFDS